MSSREYAEPGPADPVQGDVLGVVLGADDPALSGLSVGGVPLAELAARTLARLGIRVVGLDEGARTGGLLVLHDAHCPLTPAASVETVVEAARTTGRPCIGVRPVTDTVKQVHVDAEGEWLGDTVDRDALVAVTSPLVLPDASLLAGAPPADLPALVAWLRERTEVGLVEVDARSRRVADASDVALLEALFEALLDAQAPR